MKTIFALQEAATQPPAGWVETVVGALATAVVVLFFMVLKAKDQAREDIEAANKEAAAAAAAANKELMDERQKRLEDAVEYQRVISSIKERFGRRGGPDA